MKTTASFILAAILAYLLPYSLYAETVTFELTRSGMEASGYTKKKSDMIITMYDYTINMGPVKLFAQKIPAVNDGDITMFQGGKLTFSPNSETRFSNIRLKSVTVTFSHGYNLSVSRNEDSEFSIDYEVTDDPFTIYNTSTKQLFPKKVTVTFDVDVTIGDAGFATLYLNDAAVIPDGVIAYTTTIKGEKAILHPIDSNLLPAQTGVILQNQGTFTFVHADEQPTGIDANALVGSTKETTATNFSGCLYALGIKNGNLGFYRINTDPQTGETPITPYKAYLQIDGNSGKPNAVTITDDESSLISNREDLQPAERHDLSGRMTSNHPAHLMKGNIVILQ